MVLKVSRPLVLLIGLAVNGEYWRSLLEFFAQSRGAGGESCNTIKLYGATCLLRYLLMNLENTISQNESLRIQLHNIGKTSNYKTSKTSNYSHNKKLQFVRPSPWQQHKHRNFL